MDGDMQIADLDEALLVLSLKNDEISNLKSSIKTTEKKTNLKMTDLQFRIDQEKGRTAQLQRKLAKAEENGSRNRDQLEEQLKKAQEERHRQAENLAQMHAQARKKERQFKAALFQCQLQLQRQREASARLAADLQLVHRYFDPKKILSTLQKTSLEEIPSYMQVYKRGLQKTEQLRQVGLEMQRLRAQTYQSIEESFRKLSSYQGVMESLSQQNRQLEQRVRQKQQQLQLNTMQMEQKKQWLQAVREQASSSVQILSDELHTLKHYYSQQSLKEEEEQLGPSHHATDYHRAIEELQLALQEKEAQLADLQNQYQQRFVQLQEENTALKNDIIGVHISALLQKEDFQAAISALRRELAEKEEFIALLNNSIKEQEDFFQGKQREFDRHIADLSELLKRKKRAQEQSREAEQAFKMQIEALSDQLQYLKHQIYARKSSHDAHSAEYSIELHGTQQEQEEDSQRILRRVRSGLGSVRSQGERRNLLADLGEGSAGEEGNRIDIGDYEQQPIWSDLYYALLQKHNQFARRVQARLQAMARRSHQ